MARGRSAAAGRGSWAGRRKGQKMAHTMRKPEDIVRLARDILMAHHQVGSDCATEMLRRISSRRQRCVAEIARDIVHRRARPR